MQWSHFWFRFLKRRWWRHCRGLSAQSRLPFFGNLFPQSCLGTFRGVGTAISGWQMQKIFRLFVVRHVTLPRFRRAKLRRARLRVPQVLRKTFLKLSLKQESVSPATPHQARRSRFGAVQQSDRLARWQSRRHEASCWPPEVLHGSSLQPNAHQSFPESPARHWRDGCQRTHIGSVGPQHLLSGNSVANS